MQLLRRNITMLGTRRIVGEFDGGRLTTDAGALLLLELDLRRRVLDSFAECFIDRRHGSYLEHTVRPT
ncbi:MAG: transposase, partial [Spirochaetaceae bacterium]|nr:transposase [Spirochaetaceae bacterium]